MIPQTVSITELRRNFAAYIAKVRAGETLLITRRGETVARLRPEPEPSDAAYQRILSYRGQGWIGDVITPLDEKWTGDSDHV